MSGPGIVAAFPVVDAHEPVELGHLIDAEERAGGARIEVRNPARVTETVGVVFDGGATEVTAAVDAAARAAASWSRSDIADRERLLRRAADVIDEHADRLAILTARENGSPLATVRAETGAAAIVFRAIADAAAERLEPELHRRGADDAYVRVERRGFGVVGCIVPWNAPLVLTANKIAPAIAAGNAVVIKPSPTSPLGVTVLARLVGAVFPPGVVSVVNGTAAAVEALIDDPRVGKVSFTGGGQTARHVLARAATALKPVHLELGGNDPAIVLADADLTRAADGIVASAYRRAGQVCFAVKRVYVPRGQHAELSALLAERIDGMRVGESLHPETTMGPLNNAAQLERVRGIVERTRAAGREVRELGRPVSPGDWDGGHFLLPHLVTDARQEDELVRDEQFGPVLPVVAYDDIAQAVTWANDTPFGLASSVWSSDPVASAAVAREIEAGVTFVNSHLFSPEGSRWIPFGGWKQSGMGWEGSPHGIDEYLRFHSVDGHVLTGDRS